VLIEQVRLHRLLVDLVLDLDEPFRSTILARFVEGKTASAIARAQSVPESTVRWRLREALTRLRAKLDAHSGNQKAWAPAVLLFAQKGIIVAKPTKAVLVLVGLVLLLLVGGIAMVWRSGGDSESPPSKTSRVVKRADKRMPLAATDDVVAKLAETRSPGWLAQEGVKPRRLSGRVLVDGAPARDAVVRLASEVTQSGFVPRRERRTDADGRFDFGVQVATRYAVGAFVPGRVATVQQIDLRDPESRPDEIVLVLDPCTVGFFGRVIDASGTPISNAELLAQDVIGAQTDRDGAFEICLEAGPEMQGRGDELRLVVRASGYGTLELFASTSGRTRKDFVLSPEGLISGRVMDDQGRPVVHAQVRFDWDEAAPRPGSEQPATVRVVTDGEGQFEATGLSAGRHRVSVFARGAGADSTAVQIGPGESKEITVTLKQRAMVRGRVFLDGKPVGGVLISNRADNPSYQPIPQSTAPILEAVSQPDGTFVLDGIAPGDVTFSTTPHRLRSPTKVKVIPGEQDVTFEVDALGEIAGTVRRHGKPVPHAVVFARGRHWLNHRWDKADELGHFRVRGLDEDEYVVHAASTAVGAFNAIAKRIPLSRGERKELDVDLAFGARITGMVVDAQSTPVPNVFVKFTHIEDGDLGRCSTDPMGRFECASMTGAGSYRARVYTYDGAPIPLTFVGAEPAPIALADGDSSVDGVRLVVEVQRLAIRGEVVDGSNAPVADARVAALTGLDNYSSAPATVTNMQGQFELRDLAAGSYSLHVLGPNSAKTSVEGIAAGSKSIRVVLETPSCNANEKVGNVSRAVPATTGRPGSRIVWDERIELVGWDLPSRVHVGEEFTVSLVYRVLRPIGRSWKLLTHLDGPQVRVSQDHEPLDGRCLTSTWHPGDIVVDRFTMKIVSRPGTYQLWTGFFTGWEPTWKNMSVTQASKDVRDSNDRVRVATIIAE
jgi:hypothetical protein